MNAIDTDVAIIGAGTAGMSAYRAALEHTPRVLLIESGAYGTTCARVGCMPSKLLIAAADAAHAIHSAPRFGVSAASVAIDGRVVMARVHNERDRFVGFVVDAVQQWPAEHRLVGHARFVDDHTLQVGDTQVRAQRIVIATGSRPAVPEAWRLALGERLIVNDDVFDWTDLPRSVAVVGAGVIGLELAQALHRLGVRVRLYGRSDRVGPLTDPVLQALARQVFGAELPMSVDLEKIEPRREGDDVIVRATGHGAGVNEERFEWLLAATGRRPNIDQLGLENTTLPLDPEGIPVRDRRSAQVAERPVFIAGDVSEDRPLLHEAADEGRIAGSNAGRFPDVRMRPRRTPLAVVFSEPQIALAGASHAELRATGTAFETGRVSFSDQGRSRVMGRNQGALHVYGEAGTGRFLGAEMLGPAAEHIGHLLAWSVQRGDTVQQMLDSPFYHPVIEEGLRTMKNTMIDVYTANTPNGVKVPIALEELGVPYRIVRVDLGANEQKRPEFLRLNPNGRIPAIVDPDGPGGEPLSVFESGAILWYLAEKFAGLMPGDAVERIRAMEYTFFQVGGIGPMFGQAGWFMRHSERVPLAIDRYQTEANRLTAVLEARLQAAPWLAGRSYSVADIMNFGWLRAPQYAGVQLDDYPAVRAWVERIAARPAVVRGLQAIA